MRNKKSNTLSLIVALTLTTSICYLSYGTEPEKKKVLATICCKNEKYVGDSNNCIEGEGSCQNGLCSFGAFEFEKAKCDDPDFE